MSRGEKIGLSVAAFGLGVTVVIGALQLASVQVSAAGLWAMGGLGVALVLGGATGAILSWRQRDRTPDWEQSPAPAGPPSSFPPGNIQLPPEPQRVIHSHEPTPTDGLRDALSEGMKLRTRLALESQGHREGDEIVRPDPVPIKEDPLYRWARKTYDLLNRHFPEHADDFYGDGPEVGSGYFMLAFTTEIKGAAGRGGYLERRLALLKELLEKVR